MKATLNSVLLAGIFSPVVMFGQIANAEPQITLKKIDLQLLRDVMNITNKTRARILVNIS